MDNFYNKLSIITGNLLIYGYDVISVSKPVIDDDIVNIGVKSTSQVSLIIKISVNDICKAHDYTLDNLIVRVLEEYHLLHVR